MKQRFLLSLLFVCSFVITSQAQISKGAIFTGGSIGYNQSKKGVDTPYYKTNQLYITPSVGIAVKDNLVVGIALKYRHSKIQNNGITINDKANTYGAGLFVRQYIPVIGRFYVFGEAAAYYETTKDKYANREYPNVINNYTSKTWSTGLSVTPGLSFVVTKKFQLETSLGNLFGVAYASTKTTGPTDYYIVKSHNLTTGINAEGKAQFNIGCRFLINKKG